MDPITVMGIANAGGKILGGIAGGLLGGDTPQIPSYIKDLLLARYKSESYSGFMPDREAYDRSMRADIDEVMAGLPVGMDAFNSNLAARGISGAGEAAKYQYADVVAPIARAASNAVVKSNLGYAEAYQQGSIAAEGMHSQSLNSLLQMELANLGVNVQNWQQGGEFWNQMGSAVSSGVGSYLNRGANQELWDNIQTYLKNYKG